MKDVFKRVAERALQAEMTQHLGYDKYAATGKTPATAVKQHLTLTIFSIGFYALMCSRTAR